MRKTDRDTTTKAGVQCGLQQEEPAQSRSCVVKRSGTALPNRQFPPSAEIRTKVSRLNKMNNKKRTTKAGGGER